MLVFQEQGCGLDGGRNLTFWGKCCTLVNDVVNTLVERGELDPEAKVNIILVCCVVYMCCCRVSISQWWTSALS